VYKRQALEEGGCAARKVHDLDPAPGLATGLVQRLAVVAGDDCRQLLEVALQQLLV